MEGFCTVSPVALKRELDIYSAVGQDAVGRYRCKDMLFTGAQMAGDDNIITMPEFISFPYPLSRKLASVKHCHIIRDYPLSQCSGHFLL